MTVRVLNMAGTQQAYVGGSVATFAGYSPSQTITISKPRAADSGGLLYWDATSFWRNDAGTEDINDGAGHTYGNQFTVYGNNGAGDVTLFNAGEAAFYATADEAYDFIAAQLPISVTGYRTYKVVGYPDGHPTDNRFGLSLLLTSDSGDGTGDSWPPDPNTLALARRVDVLLRVATDPVVRLWSGAVRDLAIPAGGAETTDGAIYQAMGQLTGVPQLNAALNGDAERVEFMVSGVALTGEIAALAGEDAAAIRNVAVDVGLVLFDDAWQLIPPVFWLWSGTADSLTVERTGDAEKPTRTLKLSAGNVFTGRRRPNLQFFTDVDQKRRSADDVFFDQVSKLSEGTTKVWGYV